MKYYIYISDAKVDMLLPQISNANKAKIATEFKIDLKILSASRKVETEATEGRIARLEAVCNFIREYGNLGTSDSPDEYFEDTMEMNWGPIRYHDTNTPSPFVFFAGFTGKTLVVLGGAMKHVLGEAGTTTTSARSLTPFMIAHIIKELNLDVSAKELLGPLLGKSQTGPADLFVDPLTKFTSLNMIWHAYSEMSRGAKEKVTFMAKRLLVGPNPKCRTFWGGPAEAYEAETVLFATPLYVAMSE